MTQQEKNIKKLIKQLEKEFYIQPVYKLLYGCDSEFFNIYLKELVIEIKMDNTHTSCFRITGSLMGCELLRLYDIIEFINAFKGVYKNELQ